MPVSASATTWCVHFHVTLCEHAHVLTRRGTARVGQAYLVKAAINSVRVSGVPVEGATTLLHNDVITIADRDFVWQYSALLADAPPPLVTR